MQSPLFAYTEVQDQSYYSLQNSYLLRVRLDGNTGPDCLARKGAMVAYQGMIEFDGEYQSPYQRRTRGHTGEGLDLMRCSGQGTVYLANLAQQIHVLDVDHEGLTVDSAYVLALDSGLHWEVIAVDSQFGLSGTGQYNLNISGSGKVALMTSGKPLMMPVTPDKYVSCDADAVVAWSTGLRVQMQAQTSSSSVFRRRGTTGEGWELNFVGQGYVLVQPSELMPPQNMQLGGLRGQYGMGPQGARGQNPGNIWSNR
ncbi:AIM24 family protein [Streptomyces sp. NPDC020917]|uniref:AIM24 family protein n=1 Tax=Streptomyces sp. NPDC020917 TaxID=3365102 RepID=UPI0037A0FCE8